jgi:hypothetical protein
MVSIFNFDITAIKKRFCFDLALEAIASVFEGLYPYSALV